HLTIDEDIDVQRLSFSRLATRVLYDAPHEYSIYQLGTPLAPGDSLLLTFTLARVTRGFPNHVENTAVAGNGTFLENAGFLPSIGYNAAAEISDDDARRKEGLEPKPRMPPPTDTATWSRSYVTPDADWVHYDAVVSTDPDQLALTS